MDSGLLVSLFWNGKQCRAKKKKRERDSSLFAAGNSAGHIKHAVMKFEQGFWLSVFSGYKENISNNKWIINKSRLKKNWGKKKTIYRTNKHSNTS